MAQTKEEVIGARLTGAGLGGSVLALIRSSGVEKFARDIQNWYGSETGYNVQIMKTTIPGGVTVTPLDRS
jgi:galactokinase